jgi:hypothetical protein
VLASPTKPSSGFIVEPFRLGLADCCGALVRSSKSSQPRFLASCHAWLVAVKHGARTILPLYRHAWRWSRFKLIVSQAEPLPLVLSTAAFRNGARDRSNPPYTMPSCSWRGRPRTCRKG